MKSSDKSAHTFRKKFETENHN